MKKWLMGILICLWCLGNSPVYGQEEAVEADAAGKEETGVILDLFDFTEVDEVSEELTSSYTFSEIVGTLMEGNLGESAGMIKDTVIATLFEEVVYHKEDLFKVVLLAVLSAMFSNITMIMDKTEISQMGFMITYLALITILIGAFQMMNSMIHEVTEQIMAFLKVAIPSMVLSVGLCSGQATALGFGELALFVIYIGEVLITKVILPVITAYMLLLIVNYVLEEDYLSKFGGVLKSFVVWFLKAFLGVVMGINLIKGMMLPGIDAAGKNTAVKLANMIPGVEEITNAGSILVSSAEVVKNAIGGAVIVVLVVIAAIPCMKMLIFVASYKIVGALLQPIADRRIVRAIDVTADAGMLLQKVLTTQIVMVSLSIALLCIVTT